MFTFSFDQLIIQGYMYIFALATSNIAATTHPTKRPLRIIPIRPNNIQAFRRRNRVITKARYEIIYGRIGLLISQLLLFVSVYLDIYYVSV